MEITRRKFIKYTFTGFIASVLAPGFPLMGNETEEDKKIFLKIIEKNKQFSSGPLNEVIIGTGKSFIGTPYVSDTLDLSGNEALVTNLRGLDCWTFFENSLVIGRVIKKGKMTFEDYKKELEFVRYRGGIRKGYGSRLHYIIDWMYDNGKKGVVKDMAEKLGGVKLNKKIDFMTSHREYYPPLSNDETFNELKIAEDNINSRDYYYIPTDKVPEAESELKSADIFGLVTDIPGLDASHTGFVYKENGKAYIMDETDSVGFVSISNETLYNYLSSAGIPGIFLARPVEV